MAQKQQHKNKKKEDFIKAYFENGCNVTNACKQTDVPRRTYYNWMKDDDSFSESIVNVQETILDELESCLIKLAKGYKEELVSRTQDANGKKIITRKEIYIQPNIQAIKLFLDAKGRHRGFGMKPDDSDAGQHDEDQ